MNWLFKEEPTHYSYDDLVREGKTTWSGVRNNLALKYLRTVKKGEMIFYYHSGTEKQVVGIMKALGNAYSLDKKNSDISTSKEVALDVAPVEKLVRPVTLRSIKNDTRFSDFALVKFLRLSVMPVTNDQWSAIKAMAKA
ncbi:MAG: EVE domain-containing protein [archaeon]|nr:EVE domain-containing protein [archaeon]